MITKIKRRFSADQRPDPYKEYAKRWLLKELQAAGPVRSEKAVQLLEHTSSIQREATRAAIKDLIGQRKVRVVEEYKDVHAEYQLLELVKVVAVMPLDELRKEYNSIRRQLKSGASGAEQLKARVES